MPHKKISFAVIFSALCLLYLLQFFRFNLPAVDDFGYIQAMAAGLSPLEHSINIYNEWNGRFISNFFYSFFLQSGSFTSYQWVTASIFAAFCVTGIWLSAALKIKTTAGRKISAALIMLTTICVSANYIHDIFFWMGGITNYLLAVILFMLGYIFVVKKVDNPPLRYMLAVLSALFVLLSSMCSETFTLTAIWMTFVLLCAFIYKQDRYRSVMAAIFLVMLIIGLLIMLASPGNEVRAAINRDGELAGKLFGSLWRALMTSLERSAEWFFLSQLIPAAMLIDLILKDTALPRFSPKINLKWQGGALIIFGITCAWAAHFGISYALGYYGLPGRAKFIAQIFMQVFAMAGMVCIFRHYEWRRKSKTAAVAVILFVVMILPSKHFAPSLLYIGKFAGYYQTQLGRYEQLKNDDNGTVVFNAIPYAPPVEHYHYFTTECWRVYHTSCARTDRDDGYANYPTVWTLTRKK